MLALIAGTGDLPGALLAALREPPFVCALEGNPPAVPVDMTFRLEHLGSLTAALSTKGIARICLAGAIARPEIDMGLIDTATAPLVPRLAAALSKGDDGALRIVIALFEEAGFAVVGAHELAPDLLPPAGVLGAVPPDAQAAQDAAAAEQAVIGMGEIDIGQACVVKDGRVITREEQDGTDAMLARLGEGAAGQGGLLYKGPKPGQDQRADLPVIGPETVRAAARAGLRGIVLRAGGVMVLNRAATVAACDERGQFLWVR